MDDVTKEIRANLCKVGEFDLADRIDKVEPVNRSKALEYTRYLLALHGSREATHTKIRTEILSVLWSYVTPHDDGSCLRMRILIRVEQLVRECPDVDDIEVELLTLAAARDASFDGVSDLRKLSQLVVQGDFEELRRNLPSVAVSTKSYVQVLGKAYHYSKAGDMAGIDYDKVLQESRR